MKARTNLKMFLWIFILIIGIAVLLLVIAEINHRLQLYLEGARDAEPRVENTFSGFLVPNGGYRLRPNDYAFGTNSYGLTGPDFPLDKPSDEYRIALVGGTYSMAVHDSLEEYLNQSIQWRKFTGKDRTRVINFSLPGISSAQIAPVAVALVPRFSADLVVPTFIRETLIYEPFLLDRAANQDEVEKAEALPIEERKELYLKFLRAELWQCRGIQFLIKYFPNLNIQRCYPHTFALRRLAHELAPSSKATIYPQDPMQEDLDLALKDNIFAFEKILEEFPNNKVVVLPSRIDFPAVMRSIPTNYRDNMVEKYSKVYGQLRDSIPSLHIEEIDSFLPNPDDPDDLLMYFNDPDFHLTAEGNRLYGVAIAKRLIESLVKPSPQKQ